MTDLSGGLESTTVYGRDPNWRLLSFMRIALVNVGTTAMALYGIGVTHMLDPNAQESLIHPEVPTLTAAVVFKISDAIIQISTRT